MRDVVRVVPLLLLLLVEVAEGEARDVVVSESESD